MDPLIQICGETVTKRASHHELEGHLLVQEETSIRVPKILGYQEVNGKFYIQMEKLKGETIGIDFMKDNRQKVAEAVKWFIEELGKIRGDKRFCHGDIKPRNIFWLPEEDRFALIDFGEWEYSDDISHEIIKSLVMISEKSEWYKIVSLVVGKDITEYKEKSNEFVDVL